MKYTGSLLVVRDLEASKRFYRELFGLEVADDFGACVTLDGGPALLAAEAWAAFIGRSEEAVTYRNYASELGFETEDLDGFLRKLETMNAELVHPLVEHRWGQRVVRLYDPDGHVIEVGEPIDRVVERFVSSGLSAAETALRMDVAEQYVLDSLARLQEE